MLRRAHRLLLVPYDTISYAVEFLTGDPSLKIRPDSLRTIVASFAIGKATWNVPLLAIMADMVLLPRQHVPLPESGPGGTGTRHHAGADPQEGRRREQAGLGQFHRPGHSPNARREGPTAIVRLTPRRRS